MGPGWCLAPILKLRAMPISSHALLPYVVQEMLLVQPKKVLDIGIGNGIYGALIHNYASTLLKKIPRIVGVEVWGDYRCPLWDVYNEIHTVPLQNFVTHHKFELIIMMDVIEHLSIDEGQKQINRLKAMLSPGGVFIISTPAIFVAQGAYAGNPFEKHVSLWAPGHFRAFNFKPLRSPGDSLFGEKMLIYKFKQEDKK